MPSVSPRRAVVALGATVALVFTVGVSSGAFAAPNRIPRHPHRTTTTTQPPATTAPTTAPTTTAPPTTSPSTTAPATGSAGCGLAAAAFCDDFSSESPPAVSRSILSPVWGVSRFTNYANPSQGNENTWDGVTLGAEDDAATGHCGNAQTVEDNIAICAGVPGIVETTNDGSGNGNTGGTLSILAAYPRQPFDIAGRTGTASFSVTDNSEGGHGAWPTWVYSDQPLPAPYSFLPPQACSPPDPGCATAADNARNSVGFDLDGTTQADGNANGTDATCEGVGSIWVTVNYAAQILNSTGNGCLPPTSVGDGPDRFQVQISSSAITVLGAPAGTGAFTELASASFGANGNPALPLTRGLTWMEDVHYNADKFDHQALNSFNWGYFGFDGPVLPRDAGYDVPDNTTPGPTQTSGYGSNDTGNPSNQLGYIVPEGTTGKTFTVNGVTTARGTGALVLFNESPFATANEMQVSVNGNTPVEIPNRNGQVMSTNAIAVPLADVKDGTNTLTFTDPGMTANGFGETIANIDLVVQGAG